MKKLLAAILIALSLSLTGCTRTEKSYEILINNGYTDIEITGFSWFGCKEDDAFHTGFTATSPNGKQVKGVVCSTLGKGSTIRFD